MKLSIDREQEIEVNKIKIQLTDNIEYQISINKFGELVINKQQYGDGENAIVLLPYMSNEIRLK